jgi:hypothetical protein
MRANANVSRYTNRDEAELFLNGNPGSKSMKDATGRTFIGLYFQSGTLKAVGKEWQVRMRICSADAGREHKSSTQTRTKADGKDISLIEFRIVDANGVIVQTEDAEVKFSWKARQKSSHSAMRIQQHRIISGQPHSTYKPGR